MKLRLLAVSLFALLVACPAFAADQPKEGAAAPAMDPALMAKMQAAMSPSAAHDVLKKFEGNWTYTAKFWMDPSQPPMESTGGTSAHVVYGGRFLKETVKGTWMGEPFEGTSYTGYDNVRGEYQNVWIDSSMTGMMASSGQFDAATNTLKMAGSGSCPLTGEKNKPCRSETIFQDADHYTMTAYTTGPDGKEVKGMEIVSTRAV